MHLTNAVVVFFELVCEEFVNNSCFFRQVFTIMVIILINR